MRIFHPLQKATTLFLLLALGALGAEDKIQDSKPSDSKTKQETLELTTPPQDTKELSALESHAESSAAQRSSALLEKNRIALYLHKPIYFLPLYHSITTPTPGNMSTETKFQFSFKLPVIYELFSPYGRLYFAYTQTSWFQNYNKADSRPFRDVDYSPEVIYSYARDLPLFGGVLRDVSVSFNHTSNGERTLRSRTQNRLILQLHWVYETPSLTFGTKLSAWAYVGVGREYAHDNPDLARYRGYDEILLYLRGGRHLLELYMRPPIAARYYPYFELGYTIRITRNAGLYLQYINGYGDNMFEYNLRSERVGLGVRLWEF